MARQKAGDPEGARADAELSAQIAREIQGPGDREFERSYLTIGRIYSMQGDYERGIADLEHWLQAEARQLLAETQQEAP